MDRFWCRICYMKLRENNIAYEAYSIYSNSCGNPLLLVEVRTFVNPVILWHFAVCALTFPVFFWVILGVRTCDIFLCLLPIVSICFIVPVVSGLFLSLLLRHSCVSQVLTPRMSPFFNVLQWLLAWSYNTSKIFSVGTRRAKKLALRTELVEDKDTPPNRAWSRLVHTERIAGLDKNRVRQPGASRFSCRATGSPSCVDNGHAIRTSCWGNIRT